MTIRSAAAIAVVLVLEDRGLDATLVQARSYLKYQYLAARREHSLSAHTRQAGKSSCAVLPDGADANGCEQVTLTPSRRAVPPRRALARA
jgi:hypothetical protein